MIPLDDAIARFPVVGILRGCPPEHVKRVAAAAVGAGLPAIEITLDSPDPLDSIRTAAAIPGATVGAGTVLRAAEVDAAADAGATFVVSPIVSVAVIDAATPSEILTALDAGAHAVKVFPARELGGPAFLRAVRAPLRHPRLVPTGGVDAASAASYLRSGAWAVGIGGAIFSTSALADGDTTAIGEAVAALVDVVG